MRHRYIHAFRHIFIDNLNGDKYRTGKTTPEGLPDPSVFSTPQNREGIQVGTAVTTLVRNRGSAQPVAALHLRDLWGTGKLDQLDRESRDNAEPQYSPFIPIDALDDLFADRAHTAAYISWPQLPELFPVSSPGIKTSRDALLVDIDRDVLSSRMEKYFDTNVSNAQMSEIVPCSMESSQRFDPISTRVILHEKGFRPWQIMRYVYRPFDLRWLYWEPKTELLDRKRDEYVSSDMSQIAFVIAQKSRTGYKPPQVTRRLIDLNCNRWWCKCLFPLNDWRRAAGSAG